MEYNKRNKKENSDQLLMSRYQNKHKMKYLSSIKKHRVKRCDAWDLTKSCDELIAIAKIHLISLCTEWKYCQLVLF